MIKGCENLYHCYESSKELIVFIESNPLIQKMVAQGGRDLEAACLLVENFPPWSVLLKWGKGHRFALHGNPGKWAVEQFEADSRDDGAEIGGLDVSKILKAMGISAHDVAEATRTMAAKSRKKESAA
jgi:hypothetical protein